MIVKGSRVRWFHTTPVCLAGAQMKLQGQLETGTVRHVRGDRPVDPTSVRIYVDADHVEGTVRPPRCTCEQPHIELDPMRMKIDEVEK